MHLIMIRNEVVIVLEMLLKTNNCRCVSVSLEWSNPTAVGRIDSFSRRSGDSQVPGKSG